MLQISGLHRQRRRQILQLLRLRSHLEGDVVRDVKKAIAGDSIFARPVKESTAVLLTSTPLGVRYIKSEMVGAHS
ncbi:hypothetical protein OROMI_016289 [Orobanche minor]